MRATVTMILRLLVDKNEPEALRGILRDVACGEEHAFSDEQSLLRLLYAIPRSLRVDPCPDETLPGNSANGEMDP